MFLLNYRLTDDDGLLVKATLNVNRNEDESTTADVSSEGS